MYIKRILALILALVVGQFNCCLAAEVEIVKSYYLLKYEYQDFVVPLSHAGATDKEITAFFGDVEEYLERVPDINRENFESNFKGALLDVAMYREHRNLSAVIFQCYGDDIDQYLETGIIPKKFESVYQALLEALFGNGFEDKSELAIKYEEYKLILDNSLSDYTSSTANEFEEAMNQALTILKKKGAGASEISQAKELIENAYSNLEEKPKENNSGGGNSGGGSGGAPGVMPQIPTTPGTENTQDKNALFKDLNESHWSYPAVKSLTENNVINGFSDNTFKPEKLVTREEFAKMICMAFKLQNTDKVTVYKDAEENAWYNEYLQCITNNEIMNGIGGELFGIGKTFTRQDLAVVSYRIIDKGIVTKIYDADTQYIPFDDLKHASDYAKQAISEMQKLGVINGIGNNLFAPFSGVTRAQAAQIIYSLLSE